MKALDMLLTFVYGICCGLKTTAELAGYWFMIVFVYNFCTNQIHIKLVICAVLASFALYWFNRIVIEWLE